jgi:hypothetical protein
MRVTAKNTNTLLGGPVKAGVEADLVQGVFVGVDSNGDVLPADFNPDDGPAARGFMCENVQRKDPLGNVINVDRRASYGQQGRIGGLTSLTVGATYYLASGGTITDTAPTGSGEILQKVGWAISETELVVELGTPTELA